MLYCGVTKNGLSFNRIYIEYEKNEKNEKTNSTKKKKFFSYLYSFYFNRKYILNIYCCCCSEAAAAAAIIIIAVVVYLFIQYSLHFFSCADF